MENNKITALLPMKANSQRVVDKNIRTLGGKPLFFHILQSLLNSKYIFEVLINTDSNKIKEMVLGEFENVRVIDRPKELLGDKVSLTPIINYDLRFVRTKHFVQTHATTPLLSTKTIDNVIEKYFEGLLHNYDSAMGVNAFQTRFFFENGKPVNHNPEVMMPSQDMPYLYEDNSSFYIISVENFLKGNNRVGQNPLFITVSKLESIDIDEEADFQLVKAVYAYLKDGEKNEAR
jgi:CMP-N-acetylneuraminic acid synthetase